MKSQEILNETQSVYHRAITLETWNIESRLWIQLEHVGVQGKALNLGIKEQKFK